MVFNKVKKTPIYDKLDLFQEYTKNIQNFNILEASDFLSREIRLTSITPNVADDIDRIIRFWNDVDELETGLIYSRKPIKIFIDCYGGGSLSSAFTIIDAIKLSKTPIYTINIGMTCSEALYVFLAGHKRYSYPRASFLFKRELKPFDGEDNLQSNYNSFCEKQNNELKSMLLEKTKITENEYDKKTVWWMDAEKAKDLNICDEVSRTRSIDNF